MTNPIEEIFRNWNRNFPMMTSSWVIKVKSKPNWNRPMKYVWNPDDKKKNPNQVDWDDIIGLENAKSILKSMTITKKKFVIVKPRKISHMRKCGI